jgi:predicted nucleotidyltransferase
VESAGGPSRGLRRLRAAANGASGGELTRICREYGVRLLVAFGSVVRDDPAANDLDLAASFVSPDRDVLGLLDELATVAGTSKLDLMDLSSAGPVARERALVGGLPLYEQEPGTFARMQIAAMLERMDTDWLRRLDLELMAR